jgi:N-acetylglucosamine kinase-like BadF-type ATPase
MLVLGIDAGGTKTIGQLAGPDARVLIEVRGAGANLQTMGELEVEKTLHEVIERALASQPGPLTAICVGMAGVDRPGEADTIRAILARIGRGARSLVVNDALIALEAGLPDTPGVVLVAGTGSIAYGRDANGRAARAGGWGHVLGDEGSGYWIGRRALQAVMRASDGRGPATALSTLVLERYQIERAQQLVHEVYARGARPVTIAALASIVERAANAGDAIAAAIVSDGAGELAAATTSVADQLQMPQGPVVMAGNLIRAMPRLDAELRRRLAERLPHASVRALDVEPAQGAVHLALALAANRLQVPQYLDARV